MAKRKVVLLPETQQILQTMGEQIKMARLRRKLSAELVAERADVSRATLWAVEKGSPSVAIGIYAAVLHALNYMDKDL
ncbi:MAG: helix-turn-helix transcriptional regulator, partial [Oscillospiraceae bacterium]